MRNSFFILILAALFAVGCGSSKQSKSLSSAEVGDVPEWFLNVPKDPNFLYSAKTSTSRDLQLAIDKATTDARAEIGKQVDIKVQDLTKKFTEETGTDNDAQLLQMMSQATKTIVSTSLSGSKITQKKILKDNQLFRAYVLVEYPIGAANEAFLNQIKKNEQMYTRFRAAKAMDELKEEVKEYEASKKEQGQ
ncbi:MAG: hypothetical protein HGB19_05105 [Chlorobiales bacterium]|jgi:hypothetical protein|nr:hypothetical protein [Chlorobiales bacterium]